MMDVKQAWWRGVEWKPGVKATAGLLLGVVFMSGPWLVGFHHPLGPWVVGASLAVGLPVLVLALWHVARREVKLDSDSVIGLIFIATILPLGVYRWISPFQEEPSVPAAQAQKMEASARP